MRQNLILPMIQGVKIYSSIICLRMDYSDYQDTLQKPTQGLSFFCMYVSFYQLGWAKLWCLNRQSQNISGSKQYISGQTVSKSAKVAVPTTAVLCLPLKRTGQNCSWQHGGKRAMKLCWLFERLCDVTDSPFRDQGKVKMLNLTSTGQGSTREGKLGILELRSKSS